MPTRITSIALTLLLLCGLGLTAQGPTPGKEKPADKDKLALQGKWQAAEGPKITLVFKGDMVTDSDADGKEEGKATFTIDPTKTPKNIDVKILSGEDKGKTFLGIYELKENDLKLMIGEPNGKRPADFDPKKNAEHILVILKKVPAK